MDQNIPQNIEPRIGDQDFGAHAHVYFLGDGLVVKVLRKELTEEEREEDSLENELDVLKRAEKVNGLRVPRPFGLFDFTIKCPYTGRIREDKGLVMGRVPGINASKFYDWPEKMTRIDALFEEQMKIAAMNGLTPGDAGLHNANYEIETDTLYLFDLARWR